MTFPSFPRFDWPMRPQPGSRASIEATGLTPDLLARYPFQAPEQSEPPGRLPPPRNARRRADPEGSGLTGRAFMELAGVDAWPGPFELTLRLVDHEVSMLEVRH